MTEDRVAAYLLGEQGLQGDVRGLLARVSERVRGYDDPQGPTFQTGSIMGAGSQKHVSSSESTEDLFDLACELICWAADSRGLDEARKSLWLWLRRDGISDVDYLLGWEGRDSKGHKLDLPGKLTEVRETVKALTKVEPLPLKSASKLDRLVSILKGFMGECEHEFKEQPGSWQGLTIMLCDCGARYVDYGTGEWFAR